MAVHTEAIVVYLLVCTRGTLSLSKKMLCRRLSLGRLSSSRLAQQQRSAVTCVRAYQIEVQSPSSSSGSLAARACIPWVGFGRVRSPSCSRIDSIAVVLYHAAFFTHEVYPHEAASTTAVRT